MQNNGPLPKFQSLTPECVKVHIWLPQGQTLKLATLNSYAKRQNNQQLYYWLPDSIYADYGNSGKQVYNLVTKLDAAVINGNDLASSLSSLFFM